MVRLRQLYPKGVMKRKHVMHVLVLRLVPEVAEHLHLRRDAADTTTGDRTGHKSLWWIAKGLPARLGLESASILVERHRVEVNGAQLRVGEHEPDRKLILGSGEAKLAQHLFDALHVLESDYDIQVIVVSRLVTDQRVDAPSAVHPDAQPSGPERIEDVNDGSGIHKLVGLTIRAAEPPIARVARGGRLLLRVGRRLKQSNSSGSAPPNDQQYRTNNHENDAKPGEDPERRIITKYWPTDRANREAKDARDENP